MADDCGCRDSLPASPTPAPTLSEDGVDCDAIRNGTATTDANQAGFTVSFDLTINNETDYASVAAAVHNILQTRVAPAVANCPDEIAIGNRLLQESTQDGATTIVNVLFFAPEETRGGE